MAVPSQSTDDFLNALVCYLCHLSGSPKNEVLYRPECSPKQLSTISLKMLHFCFRNTLIIKFCETVNITIILNYYLHLSGTG
jgi:hypothetical protein